MYFGRFAVFDLSAFVRFSLVVLIHTLLLILILIVSFLSALCAFVVFFSAFYMGCAAFSSGAGAATEVVVGVRKQISSHNHVRNIFIKLS